MQKTINTIITAFTILATCTNVNSQTLPETSSSEKFKKHFFLDANIHSGKVINNYIFFEPFPKRKPSALLELTFGKQTAGDKNWQQHYGFPQVNLSVIGGYLGNNAELGYTIGLVPNVTLNTIKEKNWALQLSLGLGFAYFNKPYDEQNNKGNILIGSHITNMSIAKLFFRYKLSEKTDLNIGTSAIHASDGHCKLPNVGLNMVNLQVGLKHYLGTGRPSNFYRDSSFFHRPKELKFGLKLGMGMHEFGNELGPVNGPRYPVYDFSAYIKKPAGRLGSAIAGAGYRYYQSFYDKIVEDSTFNSNLHWKASVVTLFLAYEFEMGRVSLLAQGGINIYNPFWKRFTELIEEDWTFYKKIEGLVSTRLGLQYYFFDPLKSQKNIYLGLYIKANMGTADFVSIGTGFVF